VRSDVIGTLPPERQFSPRIIEAVEQLFVEAFVPEAPVDGKTAPLMRRDRMSVLHGTRRFPMTSTTVGRDLARNGVHVHVADAAGHTIESERPTRRALSSCRIGIEACATAHNRARRLQGPGQDGRLVGPLLIVTEN